MISSNVYSRVDNRGCEYSRNDTRPKLRNCSLSIKAGQVPSNRHCDISECKI